MRKKFSLVYSLLLGTIVTTSLAGCGSSEVERRFAVSLLFDDTKGTVLLDKSEGILSDDTTVTITISPKEGYEIESVKINNTDVVAKKSITFTPKENQNTVYVSFSEVDEEPEVEKFNVKLDYDKTKGDVTSDVTEGEIGKVDRVNLEIKPKEGFEILSVRHNNKEVVFSGTSASFIPVAGENLIKVAFKDVDSTESAFTVVTEYDETQGTVEVDNPNGTLETIEKVNVTVRANEGYEILSIEVNGVIQEVQERFSFKPIEGENIVEVTFKELQEETKFTVSTEFDASKGNAFTNVQEGNLSEINEVTVVAIPEDGYEVDKIIANGTELEVKGNSAKFAPQAGANKVSVTFKEIVVEERFNIEVITPTFGNVNVTLSKNEGLVGEKVTFEVTYLTSRFEIEDILLNGESIGKDARSFTPILGTNTLEIKLTNKQIVAAIDQGQKFNDVIRSEVTNLTSSDEVMQIVFDKIESQIENKGPTEHARKIIGAYAKQFNLFDEVFVKYGITKDDINKFYDIIATPEFIDILNSTLEGEPLINALTKQFYRIISDLFTKETRMDKFVGFVSTTIFVAVSMIYGQEYGYKLANYYDNQNAEGELGIFTNRIIDSAKPTNEELDRLFGTYETIGQLIYSTIGKSDKVKTPESLEKFFDFFKRIGLGITGNNTQNNAPLSEDEIYEIVVLFDEAFNKNFLSKEGYMKFIDKIYSFGDVAHLHLKLFAHTDIGEKLYVTNTYKHIIDTLYTNKEESYYLIKLIGLIGRETNKQDITDIMYVFSDTNKFEAKQLAQILIIAARRFDAIKLTYSQSLNAVNAINNLGDIITKFIYIIRDGTLREEVTSVLNFESVVNELPKLKDKRFDLESDINEVIPFAQSLIDSVSGIEAGNNIYDHKIALSVNKTNYILGETNFLVSASYDDKDISKDLLVEGFDTSKEGYFVAKITYKEYTFFKTYTVTKNGIGLIEEGLKIPVLKLDSDPNLFDRSFTFSDKVTKKFSEFDASNKSTIDTKTKGLKTGWVSYFGNYYFFSYEVR